MFKSGFNLLWLMGVLLCSFESHPTMESEWNIIHQQSNGPLTFTMMLREEANMAEKNWISLSIENNTGDTLDILDAYYQIELWALNEEGTIKAEGYFKSTDPYDIFNLTNEGLPIQSAKLPIGTFTGHRTISALCSSILGFPENEKLTVSGTLDFGVELKGRHTYKLSGNGLEFDFDWWTPNAQENLQMQKEAIDLLSNVTPSAMQNHRLASLLESDKLTKTISAHQLIEGLKGRSGERSERLSIAKILARKHSNSKIVKAYYSDQISKKDSRVLIDLKAQSQLWSKEFVPELASWFQVANNSTKFRILETLHENKNIFNKFKKIKEKMGISIRDEFQELIYSDPKKMSKRRLVSWAAAVEMWSYTGDNSAIEIIAPFLLNKTKILGEHLLVDLNRKFYPRATRVCDVALEAILRIQGKNLANSYRELGFSPPYLLGEASIVIQQLRNQLIEEFLAENIISQI